MAGCPNRGPIRRLREADGRRLTTPDLWFDDVALAVMVHSQKYHAGALDWEATVTDDEELRSAGIEVVTVTPVSIVSQPEDVLQRVHGAHTSGRRAASDPCTSRPNDVSPRGASPERHW